MSKIIKKGVKVIAALLASAVIITASPAVVKADAVSDAIAAQQAALYQQQLQAVQAYQAALLGQYQQAMADQYAKALIVFNQEQVHQQNAIKQPYMLNAIQAQQKAQYQSLIQNTATDYQGHLLDVYTAYQQQAMAAFKAYEGIK